MTVMADDGELNTVPSITNPFSLMVETTPEYILKKNMHHFNVMMTPSALETAKWNNNLQKLAERTRLGIPVTIATDPRHGSGFNAGADAASSSTPNGLPSWEWALHEIQPWFENSGILPDRNIWHLVYVWPFTQWPI